MSITNARRKLRRPTWLFLAAALGAVGLAGPAAAVGTFTDDDGNVHEGFIEAIVAEGITGGCSQSGTLYCPAAPVTRGQMATFLAKAVKLPASTTDHFSDDNGSVHEQNINRVADAQITLGDGRGGYGPGEVVTRDQMASFLVNAFKLETGGGDRFNDDNGNPHEANINALANAGVAQGCGEGRYCPRAPVQRDQMATFLGRALGLTPQVPPPAETPPPAEPPPPACDPNYTGACVPVFPPDVNCGDLPEKGFASVGSDPHQLDGDNNGVACES